MAKKKADDRTSRQSKKQVSRKKGKHPIAPELARPRLSSELNVEPIDVPPYHPIRVLLGVATRAWQLSIVNQWKQPFKESHELPNLDDLGRLLLQQDDRNLPNLKRNIWTFLAPPPPLQIELDIEGIEPATPSTWGPNQKVTVGFVVRNNSGQTTSGFVHGNATQDVWRTLVSSRWFQRGAIVSNLPSGQAFIGTLELNNWTAYQRLPGLVEISLEYWVEDPEGTICFVWGMPGNQSYRTYSAVSVVQSSFGSPLSFATDIRPLFRDEDIQAMLGVFNLASYQDVKDHANEIYDALAHPTPAFTMPCDGPWPADWVATFRLWMDDGMLP
jgi:hypothetical protein